MARKQTLKQLLGTSDERQEVTLDLRPTQLTPTIRGGGSYGIAAPPIPKETTFSQLASALGKINPIIKEYQETKLTKEKTNLIQAETQILDIQEKWEGMSDEERKEFLDQQIEGRDAAEKAINKEFRGKYELNPIALVRAQKIIGASYVDELTRDEEVDFNEFLSNRDPLEGQINADDIGEFYDSRDKEFVEKNQWLIESPLAMDGFNARLRDTRIRNQKQFLADGQKYYKENVLYPHISKNLTSIMTLPASNAEQGVSINENIDEIWKVTDGLSFAETSKMLTDWVGSVSMEDAERVSYYLPKIGQLKIGNTTVANTPEVYNVIEETIYQRQEEFDKRIEEEEDEEAKNDLRPFITEMSTINTIEMLDGDDRLSMIDERTESALNQVSDRYGKAEITFDQFQTQIDLINQASTAAKIQMSNTLVNVAETAGVEQGYYNDELASNISDIENELNATAEGNFRYSFYEEIFLEGTQESKTVLRKDLEQPLTKIAVDFELKRQALLRKSANLTTMPERVAAYRQGVQELDVAFKKQIKQFLTTRSKLSGQTPMTSDVRSDEYQLKNVESTSLTRNIPMFTEDPTAGFVYRGPRGSREPNTFTDANKHIFETIGIDNAQILEGQGTETETQNLLELTPSYRAVTRVLENKYSETVSEVNKRFESYEDNTALYKLRKPKIYPHEHEIYAGSLGAVGLTSEDINKLEFIPRRAGSLGDDIADTSVFRNPQGFRIRSRKLISQMKDGLIPITDYMEMSEESRKALAERFGADFEVFDRRQKILSNLRGQ